MSKDFRGATGALYIASNGVQNDNKSLTSLKLVVNRCTFASDCGFTLMASFRQKCGKRGSGLRFVHIGCVALRCHARNRSTTQRNASGVNESSNRCHTCDFIARFCRATLSRDEIASVTWRVARNFSTVAQLLYRLEQRSIPCNFVAKLIGVEVARQSCAIRLQV